MRNGLSSPTRSKEHMISTNKQYRTRSGHPVKLYEIDPHPKNDKPVIGAVVIENQLYGMSWSRQGRLYKLPTMHDLVEVKP